ncbi:helix-turn-helix domain-containing protein [Winogradskyella sp. PAMC22761]|nr:helix-turn-helix domain-containing protein [Winogradskyella sp. PAMC22761]
MSTKTVNLERIEELLLQIIFADKKALTLDEACLYTSLSRSYMYKLTSLRLIKFSKPLGKLVYFNKEYLDAWMLQNEHLTKDSIERDALLPLKNETGNGK